MFSDTLNKEQIQITNFPKRMNVVHVATKTMTLSFFQIFSLLNPNDDILSVLSRDL